MIVVVNQVNLFSLLVIENAFADIETVQHFIIVIENFLQGKITRSVDTQDGSNRAHYYLVNLVFFQ